MKLLITLLFAAITLSFLLSSGSAKAVNIFPVCNGRASGAAVCKDEKTVKSGSNDPVLTIIKVVLQVVSFIAGAMAVIFIMISALRFITAGGSAESIAKARGTLTYALVGVAVLATAQLIIVFVLRHVS